MAKIKKGYTITVKSWENDGDNNDTNSITVDSKELAKAYYDLMQLCKSKNNQPKGVIKLGNSCEFEPEQEDLIVEFFRANPILFEDNVEEMTDEELINAFGDVTSDLLGGSEWYVCRVVESCKVTYSDKDIKLEEVKF